MKILANTLRLIFLDKKIYITFLAIAITSFILNFYIYNNIFSNNMIDNYYNFYSITYYTFILIPLFLYLISYEFFDLNTVLTRLKSINEWWNHINTSNFVISFIYIIFLHFLNSIIMLKLKMIEFTSDFIIFEMKYILISIIVFNILSLIYSFTSTYTNKRGLSFLVALIIPIIDTLGINTGNKFNFLFKYSISYEFFQLNIFGQLLAFMYTLALFFSFYRLFFKVIESKDFLRG